MTSCTHNTLVPITLNLIRQLFSLSSIFVLTKDARGDLEVLCVDSAVDGFAPMGSTLPVGPLVDWSLQNRKSLTFKLSERGQQHAAGLYSNATRLVDGVMLIPCQLQNGSLAIYWCDAASGGNATAERLKYLEEYLMHVTPCLAVKPLKPSGVPQGNFSDSEEVLATYLSPDDFSRNAQRITQGAGQGRCELVRFVPKNFVTLEESLGVVAFVSLYEQTLKRIAQIFPKGTPLLKLPDGAILALVDAMLVGLYSNRIKSICNLTQGENGKYFEFDSFKAGLSQASAQGATVVQIIDQFNTNKAVVRDLLAANG
jgi:hypothetical protein